MIVWEVLLDIKYIPSSLVAPPTIQSNQKIWNHSIFSLSFPTALIYCSVTLLTACPLIYFFLSPLSSFAIWFPAGLFPSNHFSIYHPEQVPWNITWIIPSCVSNSPVTPIFRIKFKLFIKTFKAFVDLDLFTLRVLYSANPSNFQCRKHRGDFR